MIAPAKEVHRNLGSGFEEVIYQRALERDLPAQGLEYNREVWIEVLDKGENVGRKRIDFFIGADLDSVMLEIKAKAALEGVDFVQTLSYLRATGFRVGLLISFGAKCLEVRRLAN